MTDFTLNVQANTQEAEQRLSSVNKKADEATKDRNLRINVVANTQDIQRQFEAIDKAATQASKKQSIKLDTQSLQDLSKQFYNLQNNAKETGRTIHDIYKVARYIPEVGEYIHAVENFTKGTAAVARAAPEAAASLRESGKAGAILANSFDAAGSAAGRLIDTMARIGLSIFAVKESVGLLKMAFGGFFNETIGREIKLRETILKTQTTLASTNKVFRNGTEITDPYEKIVALTGEVGKRIDSIRERSIALAGVTSNDVIEVFGIVASQIGQIGGGLKDAEDLAISFSAALGTFNLPLVQARQEVGSILRGDVGPDSYLAKALGIDNQSIAKAKTQAGGLVKFLQERLAASVAGQRIAAQGFAGVVSNIKDLGELIGQKFGAGLLDPMLGGLTNVFEFLFKIREEVFSISTALGKGLGSVLSNSLTVIGGGSSLFQQLGAGAEGFAAKLAKSVQNAFVALQAKANEFLAPLRNIFEELTKSAGLLIEGLAKLAQGFISIKIETFKSLIQIFSNLAEGLTVLSKGLSEILKLYGSFLQLPLVQYVSQLTAQFQLLDKLGLGAAIKFAAAAYGIIVAWQPVVAFFQALVARISAFIGGVIIAIGAAITRIGGVIAAFAATLTSTYPAVETLRNELVGLAAAFQGAGASADKAGASISTFGGATGGAARAVAGGIVNFVKFNAILLAIQLAITVAIDLFGRWQQAQDKAASDRRAEEALRKLNTVYKDVGQSADNAKKQAAAFEESLVSNKLIEARTRLEEINKQLQETEALLKRRQTTNSFDDVKSGAIAAYTETKKLFDLIFGFKKDIKIVFGIDIRWFTDEGRKQILVEQQKAAQAEVNKWGRTQDQQAVQDKIDLEAEKRVNLEKEVKDLRTQLENDIFQQRQALAQKEVDIFRAAGELRIFQMEEANKKLIEGEEGASAAALESLNNYISTRERGELDIEAAKKQIVIEAANLEKQISDYRLENQKRIFELQKKGADVENVAGAGINVTPKSGNSRSQALMNAAKTLGVNPLDLATIIGFETGGTYDPAKRGGAGGNYMGLIQFGPSERQTYGANASQSFEEQIQGPVVKYFQDRFKGAGMSTQGADLLTLYRTVLGGNPKASLTGQDAFGTSPQSGVARMGPHREKALQLFFNEKSGTQGTPSTGPGNADLEFVNPALGRYESAVRSLGSAMERLRALQAALTDAKTKSAFEQIAKAAFPKLEIESYENKVNESKLALEALSKVNAQAFNPERLQLEVEYQNEIAITEKERSQIETGILARKKEGKLTDQEAKLLIADINKRSEDHLATLAKQTDLKREQLQLDQERRRTEQLITDIGQQNLENLRAISNLKTDFLRSALSPADFLGRRQLDARSQIEAKYLDVTEGGTKPLGPEAQARFNELAANALRAASSLAQLDEAASNFSKRLVLANQASDIVANATKDLLYSLTSGTASVKDALMQFGKSIADELNKMVIDMLVQPLREKLFAGFKNLFGVDEAQAQVQKQFDAALKLDTAGDKLIEAANALNAAASGGGGAQQGYQGPIKDAGLASGFTYSPEGGFTGFPPLDKAIEGIDVWSTDLTSLTPYFQGLQNNLAFSATNLENMSQDAFNAAYGLDGVSQGAGFAIKGLGTFGQGLSAVLQGLGGGGGGGGGGFLSTLLSVGTSILGAVIPGAGSVLSAAGQAFSYSGNYKGPITNAGLSFDPSGFLPKRASGGPVTANRPYVVGESGAELFVPNHSGSIISNDALGGNTSVIVNVDAKGSKVEGDSRQANKLGQVVGAAVREELIRQKRPGGILA